MTIKSDGSVVDQNGNKKGQIKVGDILKAAAVAGGIFVLITAGTFIHLKMQKNNPQILYGQNDGNIAMHESDANVEIDPITAALTSNNGFFYGYVNDVKKDVTARYESGVLEKNEEEFNFILDEIDLLADSVYNIAKNGDYKTAGLGLNALVNFIKFYSEVEFSVEGYQGFVLTEEEAQAKDVLDNLFR